MKLLQISDLHIGKRLQEFSLIDDQRFVLNQAVEIIKKDKIDAVLLCGDIYDSSLPSSEGTKLYDDFLSSLHSLKVKVFVISGNHDSPDKLHFGSSIFKEEGIYVTTNIKDSLIPYSEGNINIYSLPFIRPIDVNECFNETNSSYSEGLKSVISKMNLDKSKINIVLSHQMVLPSSGEVILAGSEDIKSEDGKVIGDISTVPSSIYSDFDYVALGHVHKYMKVGTNAYYAGSIFKYHRDEASLDKYFLEIDIKSKEDIKVEKIKINFLHDVVKIEGTLDEILKSNIPTSSYLFALLTEKEILIDPLSKLRLKFPYTAWIDYKNRMENSSISLDKDVENISYEELFSIFYKEQNEEDMTKEQKEIVSSLLNKEEE